MRVHRSARAGLEGTREAVSALLEWDSAQVFCPTCNTALRDLWDHAWLGTEDECFAVECGACEESLRLHRRVSVDYAVERTSQPSSDPVNAGSQRPTEKK